MRNRKRGVERRKKRDSINPGQVAKRDDAIRAGLKAKKAAAEKKAGFCLIQVRIHGGFFETVQIDWSPTDPIPGGGGLLDPEGRVGQWLSFLEMERLDDVAAKLTSGEMWRCKTFGESQSSIQPCR